MPPPTSAVTTAAPVGAGQAVAFDYLRGLVAERAAIVVEPGKEYLVESRLAGIARRAGYASPWDMLAHLKGRPAGALQVEIVEAMTTNETSFFRDTPVFDGLRRQVLPDLIARRAGERRLTIFSAACSSGQELYSVAMMLREDFPALAGWNVRLLGTDLSGEMVKRASSGRYSRLEVNRGLPAAYLLRHFRQQGLEWEVSDALRAACDFRQANLVEPWPSFAAQVDLLLLRNVLIYFSVETKQRVLDHAKRALRADGYLVLGNAETTLNLDTDLARVEVGKTSMYRLRP